MSETALSALLAELPAGQARRIQPEEAAALLAWLPARLEQDSGMTGPIRVLVRGEACWILEQDTRRRPVLRRLWPEEDPASFIAERREAYERMWDG
jgi:hypothetical protein